MANTVLGSLLIRLQAETSAFAKGMGDAKELAFTTSGDIVNSLKTVGVQLNRLKFGSTNEWKKSTEIVGGLIAGIGVAAVGATVAVAKEVAEQGKQMSKLSQSYGLPIESISALRVAAKLTGVDMETLTMGMGRMARNMALVSAGGKDSNAGLQLLKSAMQDGAGKSKTMEQTLGAVAEKLSKMPDSWQKTALAQQIFGKSAAGLIPFLNQGKKGMEEFAKLSEQLGLTWTEKDVVAAEQLARSIELLELKGQAFKEQYAKGVIPALDTIANAFVTVDKNGKSLATTLGETMGKALIGIAKLANNLLLIFNQLSLKFKAMGEFGDIVHEQNPILRASPLSLPFAMRQYSKTHDQKAEDAAFNQNYANWAQANNSLDQPWMAPPTTKSKGQGDTKLGGGGMDLITERIAKLKAQTEAEGRLANAIGDTVSATVLATAAAEAQKTIDELNAEGRKKGISVSEAQANTVRRLTTLLLSYKEAVSANKSLEDEIQKTNEATKSQLRLASAYEISYTAVREAENINKAAPLDKQKNDLEETITALQKMGATDAQLAPLQSALAQMKVRLDEVHAAIKAQDLADQITKSNQWGLQLRTNTQELDDQAAAILKGTAALHAYNIEQQVEHFRQQNPNLPPSAYEDRRKELQSQDVAGQKVTAATDTYSLDTQITALKQYSQAVMAGAAALREFNVQQELVKFKEQNPNLSQEDYTKELSELRQKANLEALNSAADHVHSLERYKDIDDEIKQLQQLREQIIANGETTKAVDAAIQDAERQKRDAQADNLANTGGFGGGIEGGMLKFANEWKGSGQEAMNSVMESLHGIQSAMGTAFSQMIMGTKTVGQAFAQMGRSMLESIVNACAQMLAKWIVTHVIMAAVSKMFGGGGDGTSAAISKKVAESQVAVQADAGQASADVFVQAIEAIPFPGNLAAAPALAAVTRGEVTALGSAKGGYEVPFDQILEVHKDEKVIPAQFKLGLERMSQFFTSSKGVSLASGESGKSQPSAVDRVRESLSNVMQTFSSGASGAMQSGANAASRVVNRIAESMAFPSLGPASMAMAGGSSVSNVGDTIHYYGGDQHFHNVSDPRQAARLGRDMVMEELRSGGTIRRG